MQTAFFNTPQRAQRQLFTIKDILDEVPVFNEMFQVAGASDDACADPNMAATWRKLSYDHVIRAMGEPIDIHYFQKMYAGGGRTKIEATDLYIKTIGDINFNITAANAAVGNAPGAATTFQIAYADHAVNGTVAYVMEGGSLHIYEDGQDVIVSAVDRTTDFAWQVTVIPERTDYTVNIRKGSPMFANPTRKVKASDCPVPHLDWETPGYISKIQPMRLWDSWQVDMQLDKAYNDVMQFHYIFDMNGQWIDSYDYKARISARTNVVIKANNQMFWGRTITNDTLITGADSVVDAKFPGFEGLEPSIKYGGGNIWDYDRSEGFSLENDLIPIILIQDSRKKSMNWHVHASKRFLLNLMKSLANDVEGVPGDQIFEIYKRSGADQSQIMKLPIKGYQVGGSVVTFMEMGAFTDARFIGNHDYPYKAFFWPQDGVKDDSGRNVPPIEFFEPRGYGHEEIVRDKRYINGCEHIEGDVKDVEMLAVHDPSSMFLIQPEN